jgi:hypothetical protein
MLILHENMKSKDRLNQASRSWLSPYDSICTAVALALGLVIGWLDLHTTEVAATIVPLLAVGLLLGMLQPIAAWRWAVLVVVGLPIMAGLARLTGVETAEPPQLDIRISLVALVFSLVGVYTGVLFRRAYRAWKSGSR